MIEIFESREAGFTAKVVCDGWKAAFITHSPQYDRLREMKRHLATDEVFALLAGRATIFTFDGALHETRMEPKKLYNIKKGTWHHVRVSPDALLLVVENSNTTKENTERMDFNADEIGN